MLTYRLWKDLFSLNLVSEHSYWFTYSEVTPSELSFGIIINILVTPICLCIDTLLSPLEIIYYLLKQKIEKKVK